MSTRVERPNVPSSDALIRWMVAGVVASVAFLGIVALVAALMLYMHLPSWVTTALAVVLCGGVCIYAWTVAEGLKHRVRR